MAGASLAASARKTHNARNIEKTSSTKRNAHQEEAHEANEANEESETEEPRPAMTGFELDNVEAAARAIFPRNAHPELTTGAEDLDVRGYFTALVARSSFRIAAALRLTILICAFGPLIVSGRFKTLAGLPASEREEVVALLVASPIYAVRQLVLLLKVHVAMVFGADPAARAVMMPPPEVPTYRENAFMSEQELVSDLVRGKEHVA